MTVSPMPVSIRPMQVDDVEGFHRAFDAVARERRFLTFLEAPPLEETRAFVLASLAKKNPHVVALAGEAVVGWCDIQQHGFPAHAHRGSLGMGLMRPFRGQGLGRRLVRLALDRAWDTGFIRVELGVHADNAPAIALYRTSGFAEEGRVRCAFLADGICRDAVTMAIFRPGLDISGEGGIVSGMPDLTGTPP